MIQDQDEDLDVDLWCMSHGLPDSMPSHVESDGCLMRAMRQDEKDRLNNLMDQLKFRIHEIGGIYYIGVKADSSCDNRGLRTHDGDVLHHMDPMTVQLAKEVIRLRILMFGEELCEG